jgi:hypothetical protein
MRMRCRPRPAHRRGCCCGTWNRTGVAGRPNSGIALDSRRSRSGFPSRCSLGRARLGRRSFDGVDHRTHREPAAPPTWAATANRVPLSAYTHGRLDGTSAAPPASARRTPDDPEATILHPAIIPRLRCSHVDDRTTSFSTHYVLVARGFQLTEGQPAVQSRLHTSAVKSSAMRPTNSRASGSVSLV